jgi:hypothetical protein
MGSRLRFISAPSLNHPDTKLYPAETVFPLVHVRIGMGHVHSLPHCAAPFEIGSKLGETARACQPEICGAAAVDSAEGLSHSFDPTIIYFIHQEAERTNLSFSEWARCFLA